MAASSSLLLSHFFLLRIYYLTLCSYISDVLSAGKAAVNGVAGGAGGEHAHLLARVRCRRQDEKACREDIRDDLEAVSRRIEDTFFYSSEAGTRGARIRRQVRDTGESRWGAEPNRHFLFFKPEKSNGKSVLYRFYRR